MKTKSIVNLHWEGESLFPCKLKTLRKDMSIWKERNF
nr:MAG TPA: hypothetical protein [Bacteriophage sp.]